MFLFLTFASLLFSMSSAPHVPPVAPANISQSTSIPSDLDRFQQASIYSGSECPNCPTTTNSTSAAR